MLQCFHYFLVAFRQQKWVHMGLLRFLKRIGEAISGALEQASNAEAGHKSETGFIKSAPSSPAFTSPEKTSSINHQAPKIEISVELDDFKLKKTILSSKPVSHEQSAKKAKQAEPDKGWIPAGKIVEIAGKSIAGGMIYVGKNLKPASNRHHYGTETADPALINPSLSVNFRRPDHHGQGMSYWPAYATISPEARAAYLEWLAQGRVSSDAYIGYVFLFFYGLERRVFYDAQKSPEARAEVPDILQEVERLLRLYGHNHSFSGYAYSFLNAARVFYNLPLSETDFGERYPESYPLGLKLALARCASQQQAIPSDLAYEWASRMRRWGTPFERCQAGVRALFIARYASHYGEGLKVKANKTPIKMEYMPASLSLDRPLSLLNQALPDLTVLSGQPVKGLLELLTSCVQDFEAYSRYLGRNPDAANTLKAKALLPKEALLTEAELIQLQSNYQQRLAAEQMIKLTFSDLTASLPFSLADKPDKAEALAFTQLFEKLGFGIEPDIRFSSNKPQADEQIVLFTLPDQSPTEPSPAYTAALSMLQLAVMVSASDGHIAQEERAHFQQHMETLLGLTPAEKLRLLACSRWLETQSSHSTTGFKKRLEAFDLSQRQELARFLILIANADGRIDPSEIKILKKIYTLLELDPEKVFSDIHAHQTSETGPVLVQPSQSSPGHKIPQPRAAEPDPGFTLDLDLIERKLQQTQEVQNILHAIFEEQTDPPAAEPAKQEPVVSPAPSDLLEGFDARHSALVRELVAHERWERGMFERLCQPHGLMPEGALENINDVCYQLYDDALLEDEDEHITLNPDLVKEFAR